MKAKAKGAKIIVVDPRYSESAQKADIWLQIRPGSDTALVLAMLNVILSEELYNREFVQKWTNAPLLLRTETGKLLRGSDLVGCEGEDKFAVWDLEAKAPQPVDALTGSWPCSQPALEGEYKVSLKNGKSTLCKPVWQVFTEHVKKYPPEKVEEITWVPAQKIKEAARTFAKTSPSCWVNHTGLDHQADAVQAIRAYNILSAISGNIDVKGGQLLLANNPYGDSINIGLLSRSEFRLPREIEKKSLGSDEYPLWTGPDSVVVGTSNNIAVLKAMRYGKPYPIKAFVNLVNYNPLSSLPDSRVVLEALRRLEFFVAITDYITPTNEFADLLLPCAHPLECDGVVTYENYVRARPKVVEPLWECRDSVDIIIELQKRMADKVEKSFIPWKDVEDYYNFRLRGLGLTFGQLKKRGAIKLPFHYRQYEKNGFRTPSGRIEIYSSLLEKHGYDPFPDFNFKKGPAQKPSKKYPLFLITSRSPYYWNSRPRFSWALKISPYPQLEIHPKAAAERHIEDGNEVWIETSIGKCKHRAKVTDRVHPMTVCSSFGWWFFEEPGPEHGCFEAGINSVISNDPITDSIIGIPTLKGLLCNVKKLSS